MRYSLLSDCAAGVLSILLIFTLFSSPGGDFGFDFESGFIRFEENRESTCAMNAPFGGVPFANTRIISAPGVDISEENRLLNIPALSDCGDCNVISTSEAMHSCVISDRRAEFSVRLLI